MIVAPNSPRPRAKASAAPAASPPRASGATTRKNVRTGPAPSVRDAATMFASTASNAAIAARTYSGLATNATAKTTASCVNGMLVCSRPVRPNAAKRPVPATAGGRTSGSSTSVTSTERPRKRRVASTYAVGVPNTRMSACARRVVLRLTTSASVTTGFPTWATSRAGDTRANTATTGSARNASPANVVAKTARARRDRRIRGSPLHHHRRRLDDRRRRDSGLQAELLDRVSGHDRDDAGGLRDEDLDLREQAFHPHVADRAVKAVARAHRLRTGIASQTRDLLRAHDA